MNLSNLSYKDWRCSCDKWKLVTKIVKQRKSFNNDKGFSTFPVIEKCAYCTHYLSCDNCPLIKIGDISNVAVCYSADFHIYSYVPKSIFWEFIYEMRKRKDKIDWEKALRLVKIKLTAIQDDGKRFGYL